MALAGLYAVAIALLVAAVTHAVRRDARSADIETRAHDAFVARRAAAPECGGWSLPRPIT